MSITVYMYHKGLLIVISVMNIFPHSIAPLKVVDHILRKASECTIQLSWFQNFLSSSNFQNTVSNNARLHHLASLLSAFSSSSNFHYKQRQNAIFSFLAFNFFLAVSTSKHHFKQRQNETFSFLAFNFFSAIPKHRFI